MKRILYLALPLILIVSIVIFSFADHSEKEVYQFQSIEKQSFLLNLTERGTLEASRFIQITSPILSNRAKIVEMLPEGSVVDKGEIIARFDIKPFMDDINEMEYKIKEAHANLVNAEKDLDIQKSRNIEGIENIKASIEIARIKLNDIKKGSGLIKEMELKQAVEQEVRQINMAENELADFKVLYNKGYISKREKDKIADQVANSKERLLAAKDRLKNYQTYEWTKMIKEQTIYLNEFENKLLSLKEQNHLSMENKKAQQIKYESLLRHYMSELDKAKDNIVACDVKAPIAGTLLYYTIPKGGKKSKVEIGDSIWYNQSFMQIPDTNNMVVKTLIKEVDLRFLKKEQKVKIILDSYPDQSFYGVVSYIDSIARNKEDSSVKYFETVVTVDNISKMLRSGMSATVEIAYERISDAFALPVDAIRQQKDTTYVLVKDNNQKIAKKVIDIDKIGKEYATLKNMDELLAIGSEVVVR